ncbi:MAG: 23S rRNA (adenine(2503)-C(2))-methyltransferase RlmN [Thermoanaerobaculia bacterium]|nr:23S rRNA (adenine(2503)-C(2))-methyltransferase RlmN [Thermoanaerobaculia bacterium]
MTNVGTRETTKVVDGGSPLAGKMSLLGLPRARLQQVLAPHVERSFRVDQIYRAIYDRGIRRFDDVTTLPLALRRHLSAHFSLELPDVVKRHRSADGTEKYLFRLADGATIEAVDIPEGDRRTLCVSSQAGCALACRFCVTGYWGAGRDLTAGEIVAQVLAIRAVERPGTHGLNVVFMGMGEPLLNTENLRLATQILLEQISWRRVTLSTAGVVPGLRELAAWEQRPRLAISLHAPDDERRSRLMPINKKYPLAALLGALRQIPLRSKERITFEYILIDRWNDGPDDAELLHRLLQNLPSKVNLIPLNPDPVLDPKLRRPPDARVEAFRKRLAELGTRVTVRRQRGDDVSAACGQLRVPGRDPRGFRRSNFSF